MSSTETSAELRAQVHELHGQAAQLHAEGQDVLAQAQQEAERLRAEADRVLAEGRNKANDLTRQAGNIQLAAEPIEQRAVLLEAAEMLETAIPAAEQQVADLYDELDELGGTIASLQERLAQLGIDREDVGVKLGTARDAGDVDEVTRLRTRLAAIDDVTAALEQQKRTADARVVAVGGPDDDRELAQARVLVTRLLQQQRLVLNQLDPDRFEAQVDAAVGLVHDFLAHQAELQQEQQSQPVRRQTPIVR